MKRDILKKEIEKSLEKWPAYRKLRNKVTKEIRDAIRDYYRQLVDENIGNPKKIWKAINKVLGKKEKSVKLSSVKIEGKCLTREHDILEALNQYFVSVGPKLAKKIAAKPSDDYDKGIRLQYDALSVTKPMTCIKGYAYAIDRKDKQKKESPKL